MEIKIDKLIPRGYGYYEAPIPGSKYKLIIKNEKIIAVVHRGYKLIPHEEVEDVLKRLQGVKVLRAIEENAKKFWILDVGRGDVQMMVVNSVDGGRALTVRLMLVVDNLAIPLITSSRRTAMVMKKVHKKSADPAVLIDAIKAMLKDVDEVKEYYEQIFKKKAAEYLSTWQLLREEIPDKYTETIITVLSTPAGAKLTVGEVYKEIAKRILSAKTDFGTKLMFMRKLNDTLMIIAEAERYE